MDDDDRMDLAVEELSPEQRRLVARCLEAIVRGPYLDDREFQTLMGVTREEAAEVAASWPDAAPDGRSFLTVNNALNNLLGYPHGRWGQLARAIRAEPHEVARALMAWRGESHRAGGSEGYFDALM